MAKPPIITMTQKYIILPRAEYPNPVKPVITKYFAWLPMKLDSGRWVWLKSVYFRLLIDLDPGIRVEKGYFTAEELAMMKLKGE